MRGLVVLAVAVAMAGCASLSESECRAGDWYGIGIDDGSSGAGATRLAAHRETCAKYSIEPDAAQYEAGRKDGLVHYCTAARGFDTGRSGLQYSGACPAGRELEFLHGYELGRRYYTVDGRLASIETDLQAYQSRLSVENDEQERRRIVAVMRSLELERWRLESQRRDLDWEFGRL